MEQYRSTFERKVNEVFEALETDPKRAFKVIQTEIDKRGKKLEIEHLMNLRIIRALVYERINRNEEARDEILGVLAEIHDNDKVDHDVLDNYKRIAC